jgi:Na+/proline symporter
MSNLSGSLNSLSSSTMIDFYRPLFGKALGDEALLRLSRWFTAAWGVVLIGIAVVARGWGSVFTAGLSIASIVYGPMLGAFLLGVLTRRANQIGVITGMAASLGAMIAVKLLTPLAWTWYVLAGTVLCVAIAYPVSLLAEPAAAEVEVEVSRPVK